MGSFGQVVSVFTNNYIKELIQNELKAEIRVIDSTNFGNQKNIKRIVIAYGKYSEFNLLYSRPDFCKKVKEIHSYCLLPPDLSIFPNVQSIFCDSQHEFCFSTDLYVSLLKDDIKSLKYLNSIDIWNDNCDQHIYEHLASLPKMAVFDLKSRFYPFSIITNKSIIKIGIVETYPEMELFRQLGFRSSTKNENYIEDILIYQKKIPLTPRNQLKIRKIKNDSELNLYYLNGGKLAEGSIKSKELNGEWKLWYANGVLCEKRFYNMGVPEGTWYFFDEKGDTTFCLKYKDGNLDEVTSMHNTTLKNVVTNYQNYNSRITHGYTDRTDYGYRTKSNSVSFGDSLIFQEEFLSKGDSLIREIKFLGYSTSHFQIFKSTDYYPSGNPKMSIEFLVKVQTGDEIPHGKKITWDENGNIIKEEVYEFGVIKE
jgi:antitoxin component YwqK of YwqJK toxin-antitoxin module